MGPTREEDGSLREKMPASPSLQDKAFFQDLNWEKSNTEFRASVNVLKPSIYPSTLQLQNNLQMPSACCMVEL